MGSGLQCPKCLFRAGSIRLTPCGGPLGQVGVVGGHGPRCGLSRHGRTRWGVQPALHRDVPPVLGVGPAGSGRRRGSTPRTGLWALGARSPSGACHLAAQGHPFSLRPEPRPASNSEGARPLCPKTRAELHVRGAAGTSGAQGWPQNPLLETPFLAGVGTAASSGQPVGRTGALSPAHTDCALRGGWPALGPGATGVNCSLRSEFRDVCLRSELGWGSSPWRRGDTRVHAHICSQCA